MARGAVLGVRVGVWLGTTRDRLRIAESDRPHGGYTVTAATIDVLP